MTTESRFEETNFLSDDRIIDKSIKTRTLNIISDKIKDLNSRTINLDILSLIGSVSSLVEDAYTLTMYRFQFKVFTLAINKELENIEQLILYDN